MFAIGFTYIDSLQNRSTSPHQCLTHSPSMRSRLQQSLFSRTFFTYVPLSAYSTYICELKREVISCYEKDHDPDNSRSYRRCASLRLRSCCGFFPHTRHLKRSRPLHLLCAPVCRLSLIHISPMFLGCWKWSITFSEYIIFPLTFCSS